MSFRDGLLRARGQIAFLVALIASTAVIIFLETLDAEGRIREQVVASLAVGGEAKVAPSADLEATVEAALGSARDAYALDPQSRANQAAVLNAAVLGIARGIGSSAQHRLDAETVLNLLEGETPGEAQAVAPALVLLAVAVPEYQPRVSALLSRE